MIEENGKTLVHEDSADSPVVELNNTCNGLSLVGFGFMSASSLSGSYCSASSFIASS